MTYAELYAETARKFGVSEEYIESQMAADPDEPSWALLHKEIPERDLPLMRALLEDSYRSQEGLDDLVQFGEFCAKKRRERSKNN